jgi:hypothetical protein
VRLAQNFARSINLRHFAPTQESSMKLLRRLAIGFVVLIGLLIVVGAFLPSAYMVERKLLIEAPVAAIHPLIDDLEQWPRWSPWKDGDPSLVVTIPGQKAGAGAHQTWVGDQGKGELTLTASAPDSGVEYDMVFDDAFHAQGALGYAPNGNTTEVTWAMKGDNGWNIMGRYFGLFMDTMIGPMFDAGLSKLKAAAETAHKAQ